MPEQDIDVAADRGQWGPQFMGGVADEPPLCVERGLDPIEHHVEGEGEAAQFISGIWYIKPPGEGHGAFTVGDRLGSARDPARPARGRDRP